MAADSVLPAGKASTLGAAVAAVPPQPIMWPLLGAQVRDQLSSVVRGPFIEGARTLGVWQQRTGLTPSAVDLWLRHVRRDVARRLAALLLPVVLALALALLVLQAALLVLVLFSTSFSTPPGLWFLCACIATLAFFHVVTSCK